MGEENLEGMANLFNSCLEEKDQKLLAVIEGVKFTYRELEIISCLLSGRSTKTIASMLLLSPRTIETHLRNVMRKLSCNSKESIINALEQSGNASSIRMIYPKVLLNANFKKSLYKIFLLVFPKKLVCSFVYAQDSYLPLIQRIAQHIRLAGFKTRIEKRETEKLTHDILDQTDIEEGEHIFYILFETFIDLLQGDKNTLDVSNVWRFQNPSRLTFLIFDYKDFILPQELYKINFIHFRRQENYYNSFFDLLKRIPSGVSLEPIISAFKKQEALIYNTSAKKSSLSELDSTTLLQEKKKIYNLGNILQKGKWTLIIVSLIGFIGFYYWLFTFKEEKASKISQNKHLELLPFVQSNLLERPVLIAKIQEKLKGPKGIQNIVFVGIGGSGKSTLARQYASQQKASVVWEVCAETEKSLLESFEKLAETLSQTEEEKQMLREIQAIQNTQNKKEKVIGWVRQKLYTYSNWILIYDNVEDFPHIQDYFPTDPSLWGNGKVIVTTINNRIKNNSQIHHVIQIEELSPEEQLTLFLKIMKTGETPNFTSDQTEQAKEFLREVPPFPLDTSIAAYYLKNVRIPYARYIQNLKAYSQDFSSLQESILNETGNYIKTRYNIVILSLKRLIETHQDFADLLLLVSLMDYQNIPRDLLDAYKNSIITDQFIYQLKKYSLITEELRLNHPPTFSIHRSTQEISANYLMKILPLKQTKYQRHAIFDVVDHYVVDTIEQEDFLRMKLLIYHCEAFLRHEDYLFGDTTKASLRINLGCMYYYLGDYSKAKQFLQEGLNNFPKNESYESKVRALVYLGNVYRKLGQYEKARDLLKKSILIDQKRSVSPLVMTRALGYLGIVYRNLGDFKKAMHFMKQSFTLYEREHKNSIGYAWISAHLGNTHMILGQYGKARTLLEQSLNIYKKKSENYVGTGWILGYLGNVYRKLGQYEKSISLLEQSLIIHRKHFSKNHVYIATSLAYLGNVYKDLGNHEKAKTLLENSLIIYQKTYGEYHIETARVLNNLGQVYLLEGRQDTSERFIKKALAIFQYRKHPESYKALESLADLYLKKSVQGIIQEEKRQSRDFKKQAIDSLKKALKIVKNHLPADSSHAVRIHSQLEKLEGLSYQNK